MTHPIMESESDPQVSEDELKNIIQVIASTGKFWNEWSKLKSMLSFKLKQVLSEYPEAKMTSEEQNALLGETYPDLVKRLDEALHNFDEGPPFTLQRVCEILLDARSIYPNLSKLALALEKDLAWSGVLVDDRNGKTYYDSFRGFMKNLSVTSTLTMSTEPYPPSMQKLDEPDKPSEETPKSNEETPKSSEEPPVPSELAENGVEAVAGDRDEIMTEVEEADVDDDTSTDMEGLEDAVGSSETNSSPSPTTNS